MKTTSSSKIIDGTQFYSGIPGVDTVKVFLAEHLETYT